jgi:hypothetical protein
MYEKFFHMAGVDKQAGGQRRNKEKSEEDHEPWERRALKWQ